MYYTVEVEDSGARLEWSDDVGVGMLTREGRILVRFRHYPARAPGGSRIAVHAWTGVFENGTGYKHLYDLPAETREDVLIALAVNLYRTGFATHLYRRYSEGS